MEVRLKAIIACVLWGSAFAGAKIGFEYVGPVFLSGLRFMLAGILLFPMIGFYKVNIKSQLKHWRFMLLFAFLQTFLQYGLFFIGLDKVPGSTSAIIIGAGPLFVALMAHLTLNADKLTSRKIIAIFLGLSGVLFISLAKGGFNSDNPQFYIGIALLILSNICGSYTNIMVVKKKSYHLSPVFLTSFANFTGGTLLLIVSFFLETPEIKIYPLEFYGALLWLALIPAVSFSLWYTLLQRPDVKVSELNMWKFLVPVTGSILSWILLPDESPDISSVTGIVIISCALLLLQLPKDYFTKKKLFR